MYVQNLSRLVATLCSLGFNVCSLRIMSICRSQKLLLVSKFTCTNKNDNFVKETDTAGHIVIQHTYINLRPNKSLLTFIVPVPGHS